jgi:two-component system, chemotaxis family, protein-glutamate methylesterase/glutaminase
LKTCIRVLIAEDSPTVYQFLQFTLLSQPDIQVVGWAKNGKQAVQQSMMLCPDLILMDLHMPIMNGLQATAEIMSCKPLPILMVTATADPNDVALSLEALRAGALALISKPSGLDFDAKSKHTQRFLKMIRAMAEVKTVKLRPLITPNHNNIKQTALPPKILSIAASTGGPQALAFILSALDKTFPIPILLVQHMGLDFTAGFVTWLQSCTKLTVSVAKQDAPPKAGHIYVTTSDQHLGVNQAGNLTLSDLPAIGGFRPSATYLFNSVATVFANRAAAVILTGMGNDGVSGLASLVKQGGFVVAQDKLSSVVYGMPKAAKDAGVVNKVLSLQEIANWLLSFQQLTSRNLPLK